MFIPQTTLFQLKSTLPDSLSLYCNSNIKMPRGQNKIFWQLFFEKNEKKFPRAYIYYIGMVCDTRKKGTRYAVRGVRQEEEEWEMGRRREGWR